MTTDQLEAEVQRLQFHNRHLTKRVEMLQAEFGKIAKDKSFKGALWQGGTTDALMEQVALLQEQLAIRISENEELHRQIHEMENIHEEELFGLSDKLKVLQSQSEQHRTDLEECRLQSQLQMEASQQQPSTCTSKQQQFPSPKASICMQDIEDNLQSLIGKLCVSYASLFDYYKCRYQFFANRCPSASQLSENLGNAVQYVQDTLSVFRSCLAGQQQYQLNVTHRAHAQSPFECLIRLVPECLHAESGATDCAKLVDANGRFCSAFVSFIQTSRPLFIALKDDDQAPRIMLQNIAIRVANLQTAVEEVKKFASDKILLEHDLPNATKLLKTNNECFVSAVSNIGKLLQQIKEKTQEMANQYCIDVGKENSKPHANINDLQDQICRLKDENAKLQQQKAWMDVELRVTALRMEQSKGNDPSSADEQTSKLKDGYQKQVESLMNNLQLAEAKAVHYQCECENMESALRILDNQNVNLQSRLEEQTRHCAMLMDELERTRFGYENQLSSLSEHMAQMNQRLTAQSDEIDVLKAAAIKRKA